jgi:hypothetical protein
VRRSPPHRLSRWKPGRSGRSIIGTGALYLWQGVTAHDNRDSTGTFSYTQYLISPHWNRGKSLSTLEAADLNGDGVPG